MFTGPGWFHVFTLGSACGCLECPEQNGTNSSLRGSVHSAPAKDGQVRSFWAEMGLSGFRVQSEGHAGWNELLEVSTFWGVLGPWRGTYSKPLLPNA